MKSQEGRFILEADFKEFMNRLQHIEEYVSASSKLLEESKWLQPITKIDKELIEPEEAAKLLKVSKRTLIRYKQSGKIPFVKYDSGKVMYYYEDIIAYQRNNRQVYGAE